MAKKKNKPNNKNYFIIIGILSLFIVGAYFLGSYFGEKRGVNLFEEEGAIVNEGNQTYKKYYDNYYEVEYETNGDGLILKINNPCVEIRKTTGVSMKPYWNNESFAIFDTCYPKKDLKIGDVIYYDGELDSTKNPHHRIVDIDYKKRWVRTQGDNPETNPTPDDFVSFDRILGKDIGVLNVLEAKKVVKEEVIDVNESRLILASGNWGFFRINQTCVCSSTGVLQICGDDVLNDTFIMQNDLKEEYCRD